MPSLHSIESLNEVDVAASSALADMIRDNPELANDDLLNSIRFNISVIKNEDATPKVIASATRAMVYCSLLYARAGNLKLLDVIEDMNKNMSIIKSRDLDQ